MQNFTLFLFGLSLFFMAFGAGETNIKSQFPISNSKLSCKENDSPENLSRFQRNAIEIFHHLLPFMTRTFSFSSTKINLIKTKGNSMTVCRIYFARPGTTTDNYIKLDEPKPTKGRWSSSPETSLTPQGLESASKVAAAFKDVKFDKVYCTPTTRAKETAAEILKFNEQSSHLELISTSDLDEMELGIFEGKDSNEILKIFQDQTGYPAPHTQETLPLLWAKRGEGPLKHGNDAMLDKWNSTIDSFATFYPGCLERIQRIAKENLDHTILIVSSGTPAKTPIAHAKNIPVDRIQCEKGSFYVVEIDEDGKATILEDEPMSGISVEEV
ncbi:MAG: hypothetical protein CK425_10285 [Parachlamydia sp.]|nr:MAG: hypothetical protein CK425_10285 [Parachlamydia sp.]